MAKLMQVGVDDMNDVEVEPVVADDDDNAPVHAPRTEPPASGVNADIAELKEQMAAILGVVKAQQQSMAVIQEQGLRVSDAMAMRYPDLQAQIQMGPKGWVVEMTGPWSMAHVNQVRLAMRVELQQMATRGRKEQLETTLAHRKTGIVPRAGMEEVAD